MHRKPETIAFWRGRLPHWEVVDGRYFVTLHLAGAIPQAAQERIRSIVDQLEHAAARSDDARLKVQRQIFSEMEAWLDRAGTVRYLERSDIAAMIEEAILHREQKLWKMFEFVVMPNHLHLFFELRVSGLKAVLERFKRWTGHEAARLLAIEGDRFWQDEWFDHWSRSDQEDEKIAAYIRRNPEKAGLVTDYRQWPYGSWKVRS
jgi:REP element-mobilizing transposase RayT